MAPKIIMLLILEQLLIIFIEFIQLKGAKSIGTALINEIFADYKSPNLVPSIDPKSNFSY